MPRVVVLGTGTGVGKTHVTVALARALARAAPHAAIVAVKPIETGVANRSPSGAPPKGTDAAGLEAASRGTPVVRPHPLYSFPEPLSAHLAARLNGARISAGAIARWVASATPRDATIRVPAWVLVETAGGALSPVTAKITNADLALKLAPSLWVLVAPDSLGVFHDLRATLLALEATARAPDYVVLSAAREPDSATGHNADELGRLGLPRPIAVVGRAGSPEAALAPLARALLRRAADDC